MQQLFDPYQIAEIEVLPLLLALMLAVLCATVLAWVVRKYSRLMTDRSQYTLIFFVLIPVMVLIITVVKSSLALSLGLVGALSIVRFRTPIKEPEELIYLFLAIAVGLGLGAGQIGATMAAFAFIVLLIAGVGIMRSRGVAHGVFLDIQESGERNFGDLVGVVRPALEALDCPSEIRRVEVVDGRASMTLFLEAGDTEAITDLVTRLQQSLPTAQIALIDRSRQLG